MSRFLKKFLMMIFPIYMTLPISDVMALTIESTNSSLSLQNMDIQHHELDRKIITQMYQSMWSSMMHDNLDTDYFAPYFSNAFTFTHMTGKLQTKEEYLNDIKNGRLAYFQHAHDEILVDFSDNSHATLIGCTRVEAEVYGGSRNTWPLKLTFTLEKQNDVWLMTKCTASTYVLN